MKFGKWIVIAVVGAALLAGIALAPVVLAQGPANDNSPGYGIRAIHGLTPDSVVDAFLTLRAEKLADLVTNGQLTQEQADAMLATMKANVTEHLNAPWSPRGPGQGGGPGFVDEDGDGVCDHAGSGQSAARSGRMRGRWTQQ